jgi:hypothetical protein
VHDTTTGAQTFSMIASNKFRFGNRREQLIEKATRFQPLLYSIRRLLCSTRCGVVCPPFQSARSAAIVFCTPNTMESAAVEP